MTCYTLSVRPTILDSENLKISMEKLMKKKIKTFAKKSIPTYESLASAKKKLVFEKNFNGFSQTKNKCCIVQVVQAIQYMPIARKLRETKVKLLADSHHVYLHCLQVRETRGFR